MRAKSILSKYNAFYISILILICISSINAAVLAQGTNQSIYQAPGQSSQGAPPPIGDGPSSGTIVPGDTQAEPVPTGRPTAAPKTGTNFPQQTEPRRRPRINLLINGLVGLTLQPDQLTNEQKGKVMGIIPGAVGNEPYQNISITDKQLMKIQDALAPSPNTAAGISAVPMRKTGQNRSYISSDAPASNRLGQNGTNNIQPQFFVIRKFCRYLVILGMVCGCIFLAIAAFTLQAGDRSAGARIIGSVSGLMLLLMSYAIWKVVRFNEDQARGPENRVVQFGQTQGPIPSRGYSGDTERSKSDDSFNATVNANLPPTPGAVAGAQRGGLPLRPLGAAH